MLIACFFGAHCFFHMVLLDALAGYLYSYAINGFGVSANPNPNPSNTEFCIFAAITQPNPSRLKLCQLGLCVGNNDNNNDNGSNDGMIFG